MFDIGKLLNTSVALAEETQQSHNQQIHVPYNWLQPSRGSADELSPVSRIHQWPVTSSCSSRCQTRHPSSQPVHGQIHARYAVRCGVTWRAGCSSILDVFVSGRERWRQDLHAAVHLASAHLYCPVRRRRYGEDGDLRKLQNCKALNYQQTNVVDADNLCNTSENM